MAIRPPPIILHWSKKICDFSYVKDKVYVLNRVEIYNKKKPLIIMGRLTFDICGQHKRRQGTENYED